MERDLAQHPSYKAAEKFERAKNLTAELEFRERFRPVTILHLAEHTLRQRIDDLAAYLNQPGVRVWEKFPRVHGLVYGSSIAELALGRTVLRQVPREFDLLTQSREPEGIRLKQTLNRMIEDGIINNRGYELFIIRNRTY